MLTIYRTVLFMIVSGFLLTESDCSPSGFRDHLIYPHNRRVDPYKQKLATSKINSSPASSVRGYNLQPSSSYSQRSVQRNRVRKPLPTTTTTTPLPSCLYNDYCDQVCEIQNGIIQCSCLIGYYLMDDNRTCSDLDECSLIYYGCSHICTNIPGSAFCSCPPGYKMQEDNKTCEDVDECLYRNYGCSQICENTPGGAFCTCNLGFQLQEDEKTCKDINECLSNNGGCSHKCVNFNGGYYCSCPSGFNLDFDGKTCTDFDECSKLNGGCSHNCTNFNGGYFCSCADGYSLGFDGKTCSEIGCPKLLVPSNSKLKCFTKRGHGKKPVIKPGAQNDDVLKYSANVVCIHSCQKGFVSTHNESAIECLKNSQWNASLPDCMALNCPPLLVPAHGDVHPADCQSGKMIVNQLCHFTCEPGFNLRGNYSIKCKKNLTWRGRMDPVCEPAIPFVLCQDDVTVDLLPNESAANVTLQSPHANVQYEVRPIWVKFGTPVAFSAGKTDVSIAAVHPNQNISCNISVSVQDKEAPIFVNCPESFDISGSTYEGVSVFWKDPIAIDNVGIEMVTQSLFPNSTLIPGHYVADYQARDFAGNTASCSFEIHVKGNECLDLPNPEQGDTSCFDWSVGKICEVSCNPGFSRSVEIYACDGTGIWLPSQIVDPCLPDDSF